MRVVGPVDSTYIEAGFEGRYTFGAYQAMCAWRSVGGAEPLRWGSVTVDHLYALYAARSDG